MLKIVAELASIGKDVQVVGVARMPGQNRVGELKQLLRARAREE
jgi:hypothetical protein